MPKGTLERGWPHVARNVLPWNGLGAELHADIRAWLQRRDHKPRGSDGDLILYRFASEEDARAFEAEFAARAKARVRS